MVEDHTKASDELKQIASGKSIDVPAATDAEHQKAKAKMQAMSAVQFDCALKAQMVADHKKTIAPVQHASKLGRMPTGRRSRPRPWLTCRVTCTCSPLTAGVPVPAALRHRRAPCTLAAHHAGEQSLVTSTKTGIVGRFKNAISGLFGDKRKAAERKAAVPASVTKKVPTGKAAAPKQAVVKTAEGAGAAAKKAARSPNRKPGGAARKSSKKR